MTRAEAIEIAQGQHTLDYATNLVDTLKGLGLLKLEEPKTATDKATEVINMMIRAYGGTSGYPILVSSKTICAHMDTAGIRIVDK